MAGDLSYEELVNHIVTNKPIPNVVQVPDITYDESVRTLSLLKPRPKPWETQGLAEETSSAKQWVQGNLARAESVESISKHHVKEAELDTALMKGSD